MKNIAASVRARLTKQSKILSVTLPSLIERFAMGRILWRLSQCGRAERFVLKGAQLFSLWAEGSHRPTRDLDLLSFGDPSVEAMEQFFKELLATPADPEDGLIWGEVKVEPIRKDQRYGGVRATVKVGLDGAEVLVQVDVGFGDAITPAPVETTWRELLGFPEARLLAYPPETVIAEKLEAAVELEFANSRMKDFYDLYWLSEHMSFDRVLLSEAVSATFARRGTELPSEAPLALSPEFAEDSGKNTQWNAFLKKGKLSAPPFPQIISRLAEFLLPVIQAYDVGQIWVSGRGWGDEG